MFHRSRYDAPSVFTGSIVKVADVNSSAGGAIYTFPAVSLGDAALGDYILIAVGGFTSGVGGRVVTSVTIDDKITSYLSAGYASGTQTSWLSMGPATGNATADITVRFITGSNWCGIVVYRCRDIDLNPVDAFFKNATPLTGDLLIPARGVAVANTQNATSGSTTTWAGLTKDTQINGTGQRQQSTAIGEFAIEQNELTTTATWSANTAPCIVGTSFGPKNYYSPASLTFLGMEKQTAGLTTFTFSAFNGGTNSLGAAAAGRVIYVSWASQATANRATYSVYVAGKATSIVTPYSAGFAKQVGVAAIPLPTGANGDIVITFNAVMTDCAVGVWYGLGYDIEWGDVLFNSTTAQQFMAPRLRDMSIGSSTDNAAVVKFIAGLRTDAQSTKECFGSITGLGPSTGALANAYYIQSDNSAGTIAAAMFQPYAPPIEGTCEFLGYQSDVSDLTIYTFNAFNNGTNSLGPAASDRVIYVAMVGASNTARSILGATLGGVAMTQVAGTTTAAVPWTVIWQLALPTGTNGDVVVTMSAAANRMAIGVWYTRGFSLTPYDAQFNVNSATGLTMNTYAKGAVISATRENNTNAFPPYIAGCANLDGNVTAEGANAWGHRLNTKTGTVLVDSTRTAANGCLSAVALEPIGAPSYPSVASTQITNPGVNTTSFTVALPTGLVAGDMCLIVGSNMVNSPTYSWPTGWNSIIPTPPGSAPGNGCAYRICDGTEGASITVTTNISTQPILISHRITGTHQTIPPEIVIGTAATSTAINPVSITPSWGYSKTLWIAWASNGPAPTTYPTDYTHHQTFDFIAGVNGIATCSRQLLALTDDPGTFTYATSGNRRANTIAVRGLV